MGKISKNHGLSVDKNSDGEAFESGDGVRDSEPKTAAPEKIKLLSKHEPEGLARLRVKYAKTEDNNPYKAMRNMCLTCVEGPKDVAECESANCPLWKFRFGCHPLPREVSDEQREKMRERAKRNFPNKADNDNSRNMKGEDEQSN